MKAPMRRMKITRKKKSNVMPLRRECQTGQRELSAADGVPKGTKQRFFFNKRTFQLSHRNYGTSDY